MQSDLMQRNLDFRIRKLLQSFSWQGPDTPQIPNASTLLNVLQEKRKNVLEGDTSPIPELSSLTRKDTLTPEELYSMLGSFYLIFGPAYEETISYHAYRVEFLFQKTAPSLHSMFCVVADIFEDDVLLMHRAEINFWKEYYQSPKVSFVSTDYWEPNPLPKYQHIHWFGKLAYSLATIWNRYHDVIPQLMPKQGGETDETVSS